MQEYSSSQATVHSSLPNGGGKVAEIGWKSVWVLVNK